MLILLFDILLKVFGGEKIENEIITPQDGADIPTEETVEAPTPSPPSQEPEITSNFHWIIDAGHGPRSKGKQSPVLEDDGYVFKEYEYNHDIANRVVQQLTHLKISHSQTVHLNEKLGNNLKIRVDNANSYKTSKPKRLISIHANAAPTDENGMVVWRDDIEGNETFIFTHPFPASEEMALNFQNRLSRLLLSTDRGVKTANFYMLRKTNMPACLIEVDFFTNRHFVRLSRTDAHRQSVADAIVASILELEAFSV